MSPTANMDYPRFVIKKIIATIAIGLDRAVIIFQNPRAHFRIRSGGIDTEVPALQDHLLGIPTYKILSYLNDRVLS
jgi:hypothetical protein